MREIAYEPRNVREILVELKDSSELAVDLAYSAARDDAALADEVLELESRVDYLQYHARSRCTRWRTSPTTRRRASRRG